jgi:hypothetical protein
MRRTARSSHVTEGALGDGDPRVAARTRAEAALKPLVALIVIGLLCVDAVACGGAGKGASSSSQVAARAATTNTTPNNGGSSANGASSKPPVQLLGEHAVRSFLKDFDHDSPGENPRGGRDKDDNPELPLLGHAPTAAEIPAIIGEAKRYFAVAASGDGRKACTMIVPSVAQAVALNFGRFGFPYARKAKTCQETATLIFKHLHHRLSTPVAAMNVLVNGEHAYVLLGSRTMPTGFISLLRWHGAWLMDEPIGGDMW